jgi:hypothetical protein
MAWLNAHTEMNMKNALKALASSRKVYLGLVAVITDSILFAQGHLTGKEFAITMTSLIVALFAAIAYEDGNKGAKAETTVAGGDVTKVIAPIENPSADPLAPLGIDVKEDMRP